MGAFLKDDQSLSPVVGIIVLIAVTTALLSTTAVFVFDVTETVEPTPEADFAFTYDGEANELIVRHEGGNRIDGNHLYIRGENIGGADGSTWTAVEPSHTRVITGATITMSANSDYDIRIVYEDGEESETLARDRGPSV